MAREVRVAKATKGKASASGEPLILGKYRGAPQRRSGRRSDWTKAKADAFTEVLADTCNVTLAARAIGRSIANVYKHRARDASFRTAWEAALSIGYSRLELMMLERALHGVEKIVIARDGTTTVMREYPDRVALTLLRMHRETAAIAGESVEDGDYQEACERIVARLQRLREQEEGTETAEGGTPSPQPSPRRGEGEIAPIETKGLVGRGELIGWGLARR